jgi:hypothetical protein
VVGIMIVGSAASLRDRRLSVPRFFLSITIILAPLYPNISPNGEQINSTTRMEPCVVSTSGLARLGEMLPGGGEDFA